MRVAQSRFLVFTFAFHFISVTAARADFEAAKRAYQQGDYAMALKEVKPLAEQGNAEAQVLLGTMCNLGRGVPLDISQATKWYKAAADQGNAEGQCRLGSVLLKTDAAQGLRLLNLSAGQGFADAYLMLGLAYMNLKEVPRDPIQADMWLRLAAAHGDPIASRQLSKLESRMTKDQIVRAQALAAAWRPELAHTKP